MMICDERPVVTGGSSVGDGSFVVASLQSSKSVCSDKGGAVNGCRLLVMLCCVERLERERPTKLLIEFLQKSNIKSNEICTDLGVNLQSLESSACSVPPRGLSRHLKLDLFPHHRTKDEREDEQVLHVS